ncbi:AI-2E family transporter [Williamwhitmania taraxaci]|uniref:Predicted PurR-regulated permease PerM n=1 Tax=Williamwhitmania taraxaci TaxID=1640674 RepID=A0A1G6RZS1_9BACT|nr:AI-2E family transporter [Williamwhitmania taraxaci]SDD09465.1 Predicted PurR-regulated permease PerM [Williamwhitmania taraxaci]
MDTVKLPFYAKASLFLIGLYFFITILYIAQGIILPLVFAVIIAILLHPLVNFFVRKKINRIVAITFSLVLTVIVIGAFGQLLFSQARQFSQSWPILVDKFTEILNNTNQWASGYFDVSPRKIMAWVSQTKSELINTSGSVIGQTLLSVGNGVVILMLIPVYVFMILVYEPLLIEFFRTLFGADNRKEVSEIITKIKRVIQGYLSGLFIEAVIMAALNSIGLLILGIDYAILLGIIGALLNIIPYIGGLVAVALPMMIAIVTKTSAWYAVYVLIIYYIIQLIDNNYIVPKIVASKVKINALVSIIVVIAFGALWGFSGMFLSIPLTAIVKVICDRIEVLKPLGFLLGDTMPTNAIFNVKLKKKTTKKPINTPITT